MISISDLVKRIQEDGLTNTIYSIEGDMIDAEPQLRDAWEDAYKALSDIQEYLAQYGLNFPDEPNLFDTVGDGSES